MPQRSATVLRLALVAAALYFVMATVSRTASAAELLMFEDVGCPWCDRWRRDVGVAYPKTAEGHRAPLRSLKRSRALESGVALAGPIVVSPTFVLVDGGREVGRITGHPGPDFFWGLLGELLERLDRGRNGGAARHSNARGRPGLAEQSSGAAADAVTTIGGEALSPTRERH